MRTEEWERVVQAIAPGSRLVKAWELRGGVSAQVTALELELPRGDSRKFVVRRHGPRDRAYNPNIAADEFRLLGALQAAGMPTPAPVYLDVSRTLLPTPYLVLGFIEGTPFATSPADPDSVALQLADVLARIHRVGTAGADLDSYLKQLDVIVSDTLAREAVTSDEAFDEALVRATLRSHWPRRRANESALVHGDFWPGNTLWQGERLAGVIDWEDAAIGDPLADLANGRLEILWALGSAAMDVFTRTYLERMPEIDATNLPIWDLWADLRLAPRTPEWTQDQRTLGVVREKHGKFIAQALRKLA
jgi:aminoglycoside phosphotransferase (APT) family kinase protein